MQKWTFSNLTQKIHVLKNNSCFWKTIHVFEKNSCFWKKFMFLKKIHVFEKIAHHSRRKVRKRNGECSPSRKTMTSGQYEQRIQDGAAAEEGYALLDFFADAHLPGPTPGHGRLTPCGQMLPLLLLYPEPRENGCRNHSELRDCR